VEQPQPALRGPRGAVLRVTPTAYRKFDERSDGFTKVLIKFDRATAA
jgi:hypothetical protein